MELEPRLSQCIIFVLNSRRAFFGISFNVHAVAVIIMSIAELEQSTLCLLVSGTAGKMQPAISCNRDINSDLKRKNKLKTILAHLRRT